LNILFDASVPKDIEYVEANEDIFRGSSDGLAFALSDGATESFNSRGWAEILVDSFLMHRDLSLTSLHEALEKYAASFVSDKLTWSQVAAFERGSFATLLGVRHKPDEKSIEILAVGDSFCVLLENEQVVKTFPFSSAMEFDARPQLLSTIAEHNILFGGKERVGRRASWSTATALNAKLLCMSDALGRWFLQSIESDEVSTVRTVLDCFSDKKFKELVLDLRRDHQLKVDDTTLIVVGGL
jgi:hypothetical protein